MSASPNRVTPWPWLPGQGTLLELSAGPEQPPLFMAHGHLPGIGFEELLRRHFEERPMCLLTPWLREQTDPEMLPTIELQAQSYLAPIRARQPHGPYWLVGYSGSGFVTLELGRELSEAGERVAVALVDVDLDWRPNGDVFSGDDVADFCTIWPDVAPAERCLAAPPGSDERLQALIDGLFERHPEDAWIQHIHSLSALDLSYGRRFVHGHMALVKGIVAYDVTRYRGPFALFEPEAPNHQTGRHASEEWVRRGIEPVVHRIPGNHTSLFSDGANLKRLAQLVRTYLEAATSRAIS